MNDKIDKILEKLSDLSLDVGLIQKDVHQNTKDLEVYV